VLTGAILAFAPIAAAVFSVFATIVILAVTSRRLHDLSWSGWLQVAPMLPVVFVFILDLSMARTTQSPGTSADWGILQMHFSTGVENVIYGVSFLPMLIFQIWLLAARGVDGPNVYGEGSISE